MKVDARAGMALIALWIAPGCSDVVGRSCEVSGAGGAILFEVGHSSCDGATCVQLAPDQLAYCTENCIDSSDCPSDYSCELVTLSASLEQSWCVADDPQLVVDDDDDDDPPPVGSPPVLSELSWEARAASGGGCELAFSYLWRDEDGDLNGASTNILLDSLTFSGRLEEVDTQEARLTLTVPIDDQTGVRFGQSYNLRLWMRDRGRNDSNELTDVVEIPTSCP